MRDPSTYLDVMTKAAKSAGEGLIKQSKNLSSLDIRTKLGPSDLVSIADENAEQICRAILLAEEPSFEFVGEESSAHEKAPAGFSWIVDPLDGTTNFLFGNPLWAVNVALAYDGNVVAGVTYIPVLDEMFTAAKGTGTKLNGKPVEVSDRSEIKDCLLACGIPFATKPFQKEFVREMDALVPLVTGIRRTGSCAIDMAWVACGRWDAYWERYTNAWDMAPGIILVEEAGGQASSVDGKKIDIFNNNVCVTNQRIHTELIQVLKSTITPQEV